MVENWRRLIMNTFIADFGGEYAEKAFFGIFTELAKDKSEVIG